MTGNILRYRARTEWYGIELFDREEGRVIPLDRASTRIFQTLLHNNKAEKPNLPSSLAQLEVLKHGRLNVEPLIDTLYPKTTAYVSAPRRIYWELTRQCNLNCRSCFNRFFSSRKELSFEEIMDIAEQLYKAGVYEIRCTGGEPTVRPDFFEIVDELHKMGFYLSMGTNGVYSKDILKKVLHAPIDWIILSIDGTTESSHAEIRSKGNFHRTLETLENLVAKECRIRINTLIRRSHYKYKHLKGLAQLCDLFNVESLNCIPLRPVTNDPDILSLQLNAFEFREFIEGLNRLRHEHRTDFVTTLDLRHTNLHDRIYYKDRSCAAGREGAVISPYGEIYGCSYSLASIPSAPADKRERYVAGDLLAEPFQEVWNRSERWAIFRDLDKYKSEKCKRCNYYMAQRCIGNCPIMDENNPAAFDPYCYLHLVDDIRKTKNTGRGIIR